MKKQNNVDYRVLFKASTKLLDIRVKMEFGENFTARISSSQFFQNRLRLSSETSYMRELVYVKSKSRIDATTIERLKEFILEDLNLILRIVDVYSFQPIQEVKLHFV